MSKWDEAHTEPLHDHPAEKDQLVAAMEAAGYILDTLEINKKVMLPHD